MKILHSDGLTMMFSAYIGYVGNSAWRVGLDNWSPVTLVIHGIERYPAYEHSKGPQDILLENQHGNPGKWHI